MNDRSLWWLVRACGSINFVKAVGDIVNLVLATGDGYIYSGFNLTAFFHFSYLIALWSGYQNLCWPNPGGLKPVDADLSFKPCAPTSKTNISTKMTIHTRI